MNTKAAVILMIGLLGSPVAYNFTQPRPVADDLVWDCSSSGSLPFFFNRRSGEWFTIRGGGIVQPGRSITDLDPTPASRQLVQAEK
jgi:hypothetical protein